MSGMVFLDGPQEQVAALQLDLVRIRGEHRASLATVTRSLSDLTAKFEGAETSWVPWADAATLKAEVSGMKSVLEQQIEDAKQREKRMCAYSQVSEMKIALEQQIQEAKQRQERAGEQTQVWPSSHAQALLGEVRPSPHAQALLDEVAKSEQERRRVLSEVAQSLQAINTKLESAATSWNAWTEVSDAKQQLADVQGILGQQSDDAKQQFWGRHVGQQSGALMGA